MKTGFLESRPNYQLSSCEISLVFLPQNTSFPVSNMATKIDMQSARKRRITRIGTHVFSPGTHDFR